MVTKFSNWLYWWYLCFVSLTRTFRSHPKFFKWLTCYHVIYNWKWKAKQNVLSWAHRLFLKIKHLPLLFTKKPTFRGVYTDFHSFLTSTCKFDTVHIFAYRYFRICSSWIILHTQLVCLKETFFKNGYPEIFKTNVLKNLWTTYM